tara:strand:+ start:505 stop:657 length:153 start_codon:yes stop_codon:yes gene_type:complete
VLILYSTQESLWNENDNLSPAISGPKPPEIDKYEIVVNTGTPAEFGIAMK